MAIRFASFLAPNMWPVYEAVASYVGAKLGVDASLVAGTSFDQFERGEVDISFL